MISDYSVGKGRINISEQTLELFLINATDGPINFKQIHALKFLFSISQIKFVFERSCDEGIYSRRIELIDRWLRALCECLS